LFRIEITTAEAAKEMKQVERKWTAIGLSFKAMSVKGDVYVG
jgi:hypothetical protein